MEKEKEIQRRFGGYLRRSPTADQDLDRLVDLEDMSKDAMMVFALDMARALDGSNEELRALRKVMNEEAICALAMGHIGLELEKDEPDLEVLRTYTAEAASKIRATIVLRDILTEILGDLADD